MYFTQYLAILLQNFQSRIVILFGDTTKNKKMKLEIVFMKHYAPNHKIFFNIFHQVIYSLSSISWPSLKLLAVIVFEISWLQNFIMTL